MGVAGELMWGVARSLVLGGLEIEGPDERFSCCAGSAGSADSAGSAGSAGSVGSVGSAGSAGRAGSSLGSIIKESETGNW